MWVGRGGRAVVAGKRTETSLHGAGPAHRCFHLGPGPSSAVRVPRAAGLAPCAHGLSKVLCPCIPVGSILIIKRDLANANGITIDQASTY